MALTGLLAALGFVIENLPPLAALKTQLRKQTVGADVAAAMRTARLLKRLNILHSIDGPPSDFRFQQGEPSRVVHYQANVHWRFPTPLLSCAVAWDSLCAQFRFAIRERNTAPDLPIIALEIPETDLAELRENRNSHGQLWERRGDVSLLIDDCICFGSGVGVRLHGGDGKRSAEFPSLRLCFHRQYGKRTIRTSALPWTVESDIDEIVLRKDHAFITALSFDLAKCAGAQVPPYQPALLYLNGRPQGLYTVTRRVNQELAADCFNDPAILCYRYKGKMTGRSRAAYTALHRWLAAAPSPLPMSEAARHVDLDNFSRHIFSIMYCGTTDGRQGAAVKALGHPWRWINWDMDGSFIERGKTTGSFPTSVRQPPSIELITYGCRSYADHDHPADAHDFRSLLFLRLCAESPEYRRFFVTLSQQIMDEALSGSVIDKTVNAYEKYLPYLSKSEQADFIRIREVLQRRSAEVRLRIRQYMLMN